MLAKDSAGRRAFVVVVAATVLVPVVLLIQYLLFVLFVGYHVDHRETDGWDSWACFRAVVFIGAPSACEESFANPTPLASAAAAGGSLVAGLAAAAAVVTVSGPWKDRRFEVERSVRLVTAFAAGVVLLWTGVSTFGLFFADALAV